MTILHAQAGALASEHRVLLRLGLAVLLFLLGGCQPGDGNGGGNDGY